MSRIDFFATPEYLEIFPVRISLLDFYETSFGISSRPLASQSLSAGKAGFRPLVDLATTRGMLIYFANIFVPEVRNLIPHLPGYRLSSNKHFKFKFRNSTLFISTIFITLHLMISSNHKL